MTVMSAYRGDLPHAPPADATSAHPAACAPTGIQQFRLFSDADCLVLAGSVDVSEADRLARLLAASPATDVVRLDLSGLEFVDVTGCRVIGRWAGDLCRSGGAVEIRGASRPFHRIWDVLELSAVASVTFTERNG